MIEIEVGNGDCHLIFEQGKVTASEHQASCLLSFNGNRS